MDIFVRKASLSDAFMLHNLINEIMKDGKSFYSDRLDFSVSEYRSFLEDSLLGQFSSVYVALIDQNIVGWGWLARKNYKFKKHIANLLIGVDKNFRRLSIGKHLVNYIERDAYNSGIEKIDVYLRGNDDGAFSFFSGLGYIQDGLKKDGIKVGNLYEDEILMSKKLI